ncbi:2OG-Fe(II) oxygenase [Kaistia granuli]|uniref:2OG-Fe(II) oxygenase n=1 Tax=Kaistia granuli TaxID=363259 RepID=UPI00035EE583|nr:2OG-Fe(II) oxygenase [Kaistia granuli]
MNHTSSEADDFDSIASDAAIASLAEDGYAFVNRLFDPALIMTLAAELAAMEAAGTMATAAVGRDGGLRRDVDIRRAAIRWFDGGTEAERRFLAVAELLRIAINRRLFLGLFDFECNFIAYPTGGFYGRHLDSLAGARNRVVSLIVYLDADWQADYGGALRLWSGPEDQGAASAEIVPQAGRVVLMMSEEIPHEVLPSHRPRHAIAGWWRVNASTGQRLDTSR